MWTDYFESMFGLMVMAMLLRASYDMSRPVPTKTFELEFSPKTEPISQHREWADKAVKKYTEAQDKKWRRWNEAMFEPIK
jgi:hypothetical protein